MSDKNLLMLPVRVALSWLLLTLAAAFTPPWASAQTPLPPGCQELVRDGGFEAGDQWLLDVTPWQAALVAEGARSGQQAAFIGLQPENANVESHSLIQQRIAFPADAEQITLSLWLRPQAQPDDGDRNYVLLLSDQGELIAVPFFALVTGDDWQEQVFDVTEVAGQTLNLQIGVLNNGVDQRSALLVDDVSIIACSAVAQDAAAATAEPTNTPSATPEPTAAPSATPSPTSQLSATPSATPSPQPTATERVTETPTPLAADTPTPTPTIDGTAAALPAATPTSTPTLIAALTIERPQRQLPLLDSTAAPILIGTLASSVIILAVLAVNTRRPGR